MAENFEKTVENIVNELRRLYDIEKAYNLLVKVLEKTSEKDIGVQQDERVFERIAAMKKSPGQSDQIQQISEALRKHGLTLVKTAAGYDVVKLGDIVAQQEPVAKVCPDLPGSIGWNPNLTQLPDEGSDLFTSQPSIRVHGWVWKDRLHQDGCSYVPSYTPAEPYKNGELFALVDPADLHEPLQNTKWF